MTEKVEITEKIEMIDGKDYWLGATWAKYNKETDSFCGGNWFCHRCETIYRDEE